MSSRPTDLPRWPAAYRFVPALAAAILQFLVGFPHNIEGCFLIVPQTVTRASFCSTGADERGSRATYFPRIARALELRGPKTRHEREAIAVMAMSNSCSAWDKCVKLVASDRVLQDVLVRAARRRYEIVRRGLDHDRKDEAWSEAVREVKTHDDENDGTYGKTSVLYSYADGFKNLRVNERCSCMYSTTRISTIRIPRRLELHVDQTSTIKL